MPMMRYRLNEAEIVVPDGWQDHSINTFLLPASSEGAALSLTVTREYGFPTLDLTSYTDQQLILAAKKLAFYKYNSRVGIWLAGQPAIQVDYTWRTPEGANVYQRQAVVKVGSTFLIITFTSMYQDFQRVDPYWQQILQSIQLN
jgi:hypothetical protein